MIESIISEKDLAIGYAKFQAIEENKQPLKLKLAEKMTYAKSDNSKLELNIKENQLFLMNELTDKVKSLEKKQSSDSESSGKSSKSDKEESKEEDSEVEEPDPI